MSSSNIVYRQVVEYQEQNRPLFTTGKNSVVFFGGAATEPTIPIGFSQDPGGVYTRARLFPNIWE